MTTTPQTIGKLSLPADQIEALQKGTPQAFVDHRQGPGGMQLAYVETGYVIATLNKIFGHVWTFEIVREGKEEDHIWVLGRLRVQLADGTILTKEQYGSQEIKKQKMRKCPTCSSFLPFKWPTCKGCRVDVKDEPIIERPLSIGDDYKAAGSDALKKCSSMLGLASDVYFPKLHQKVAALKEKMTRKTTVMGEVEIKPTDDPFLSPQENDARNTV